MWEKFKKLKVWVVEQVLWAEKDLKGKSGEEKKAIVVQKLDDLVVLPWFLEWMDGPIISWLVDLACEKLNWLTDYDFSDTKLDEAQTEKVASVLSVSVASVAETAGKSVEERLDSLYEKYGIEKPQSTVPTDPTPAPTSAAASEVNNNWERSIKFSLKYEGGLNFYISDDKPILKNSAKNDKGGPTAYGITIPTLKTAYASGVVSHADICKLTQDEAKLIYKKNFWDRYGWGEVAWPVCLCCLDCCINHGGFAWILQRAAADCGQKLAIDGKFGPKTFAALKACEPKTLAAAIVKQRKAYYEKIIARTPSQEVFRKGWMDRVEAMAKAAGVK